MSTRVFNIHPLSKYRQACSRFSEPREILSFSYSEDRKVCMDNRELKYYFAPQLDPPPCLVAGFENQIQRDSTVNEHINGLLTSLCHAAKQKMDPRTLKSDFVMYRGMLTRIFTTPYTLRESWAMNVTKLGSTLYIEEDLSPEDIKRRSGSSDQHRELMYSGYRFESLCVLNEPPSSLSHEKLEKELEKRHDSIVNTNTEYCTVFRTRLGVHSIISGAEIDCIDGEKPAEFPNRHYRELKTANVLDTQHKMDNFERYKLLRFWAQSFISGTPTITVGYRDSDCILRAIEDIRTQDIPHRVKGKPRMWSANVCINFADMLLGFIKNSVTEEGPEFQYRISFDAGSDVIQLTALGPRKPFLTQEYISVVTGK